MLEHCVLQVVKNLASLRIRLCLAHHEEHPGTGVVHHLHHHGARLLEPKPVPRSCGEAPHITWQEAGLMAGRDDQVLRCYQGL